MLEHVYFPKHARLSGQEDNNPDYGFWFQSFLELAELSAILFKGGADQHIDPILVLCRRNLFAPDDNADAKGRSFTEFDFK